jgi:hypothetical protein
MRRCTLLASQDAHCVVDVVAPACVERLNYFCMGFVWVCFSGARAAPGLFIIGAGVEACHEPQHLATNPRGFIAAVWDHPLLMLPGGHLCSHFLLHPVDATSWLDVNTSQTARERAYALPTFPILQRLRHP